MLHLKVRAVFRGYTTDEWYIPATKWPVAQEVIGPFDKVQVEIVDIPVLEDEK